MWKRTAGVDVPIGGQLPQQQKRQRVDDITTRIFVGSLAYSTNWQTLKDHFNQVGEVEFASVLLKPDGSSKGCGMVNFRTAEEAASAVEQLNESMLDGRRIMVKLDVGADLKRPPQPTGGGQGRSLDLEAAHHVRLPHRSTAQDEGVRLPPEEINRVFVGNLSFTTNWQGLKDHFKTAGNVEFASILENPDKSSKGVGLVNYFTHDEAVHAVDLLNESVLDGRQISVKLDVDGRFKERPPPKSQQPLQQQLQQLQQQLQQQQQQAAQPAEDLFVYKLPPDEICRVFVGNLSYDTNWQALKDHFTQAGEIEFASVLLNHDRTSKGVGMVNFRSHEDALRAVEMLGNSLLDGRNIHVKLDVDGHFKERPAAGARPRVFQRPKESGAATSGDNAQALATAQVLTQALTQAGYAASPSGRPPPAAAAGARAGANSPAATTLDCLTALGRLAQSPVAGQIDWPNLIATVASTVASATGAPKAGGPRNGPFLR
uniref:RRM domain-containing protein n=1 Tax=Alexandrium catenella TaxID=2925 RepID=A0A7S1L844_ALECA